MGLKQLLEQGQTLLSVGSFPGDVPINDPQSGFIQENSSIHTFSHNQIGKLINAINCNPFTNF